MSAADLAPYQVRAFNTAHDSENKIHDDATARRFGFGGGLVPGVDVYGYMTHLPVMRWGRAWLERGIAECRFFKPVYDGDAATVTAEQNGDALDLIVESRGEICARGQASLADGAVPPAIDEFRAAAQRRERPPFARSKRDAPAALRGYRKLARLAAQLTAPGGILFLASCSHNVGAPEFAEAVRRGLADAGRGARILKYAGASPDHPVHPALPETAYLKAMTLALD